MTIVKALLGGVWSFLRSLPWQLYAVLGVLLTVWLLHAHGVRAGDRAARAELAPMLMQAHADAAVRLQQAADAEGRALALDAGLQACIGERNNMATITSAVLSQRAKSQAQAQRDLAATRQELSHAYSLAADSCAAQPVPGSVLGVLDDAAARASRPDADADDQRAGAAVRAGAGRADGRDACAATPWRDVPGHDGLDRELGCQPAAVQRGQGCHLQPTRRGQVMNRRTAITNLAALTLASCTGEAVYARGEVSPVPTEAEIWANPTAHGVMPLPYIRDELMRLTAQAVIWREWYRSRHEGGHAVYVGDVNGMATALRLMGVAESIDIAWAHQVVATLGQPLSDHSDTPWIMWPGNNAWRQPKTVGAVG